MAERALHIGVDGRELVGQPTGVGRYLERVLSHWRGSDWPHRLTVFLHSDPPAHLASLDGIEWRVERAAHGGTAWEQTRLPRSIVRAGVDVFFAVGYTAPVRMPCPFVVVVHDVSFFTHPEWFAWRERLRRRWLTRRAARGAATVLTVSSFSADEIAQWLGVPRARIELAPPGAPDVPGDVPVSRSRVVLYVGSILNRRHVPELVTAFADVCRRLPDARLVLVGINRSVPMVDPIRLAVDLGVDNAVEWRAYVDDEELGRLYRSASVFAFLSEYEGFAMTPMEALAHGVPSVLLDTPVAREVYGDGALCVPLRTDAIVDALTSLLTDDATRTAVLSAGRERLSAYSWVRTAGVIRRALERAARER